MHPLPRRKCDFNWKSIPRTIKLSFFNSHENFSPLSTHNQDSFSMQSHNFNLKFERCSAHKSTTTLDLWKIAYDNWKRHLLDCRWRGWNKWKNENRLNCGFCYGDTRPLIGKKMRINHFRFLVRWWTQWKLQQQRIKTEEEKTRRQIEQEKQSAAPFTIVHINQGANEV